MRRFLALVLCAAAWSASCGAADAAGLPPREILALERISTRITGLMLKSRVKVEVVSQDEILKYARRALDRDYPNPQQAHDEALYRALGLLGSSASLREILLELERASILGLYDPITKRLLVRAGKDTRRTALHELVHVLQDQAFDLRRLAGLRRGQHDAALAGSAAVEGHASLVVMTLGGRMLSRRSLASHGVSKIRLFLDILREFPYATGLRFSATLHNLGGRRALFASLRRFPTTTEQIFHIDAFLAREEARPVSLPSSAAGFGLESVDTFGELDVRALLAVFQVPRLDHVGEGWGGGLSAVYRDAAGRRAVALALDWDSERDAEEWAEAVEVYVNEAFDADAPGFPPVAGCESCWQLGSRSIAFRRASERTVLVFGPTALLAHALSRELLPSA